MTYQPAPGQPGSRPDKLTANERRMLEGLTVRHPSRGRWWTPGNLISYAAQGGRFAGCSPQGLHQTGASLVRKGLAEKIKREGARSPVEYAITPRGRAIAGRPGYTRAQHSAARQAAAQVRGQLR